MSMLATIYLCAALAVALGDATEPGTEVEPYWPKITPTKLNTREIAIPINFDPARRDEIKELFLYVTSDKGKTWRKADTATPDRQAFVFRAETDDLYGFCLQITSKNNQLEPADITAAGLQMQVLIDTRPEKQVAEEDGSRRPEKP